MRFLTILALSCSYAHAESVPALINYQGHLTDAQGKALPTADYALSFSIHDADLAGNVVWGPQTFDGVNGTGRSSKVPVVDGWFNLMLGPEDTQGRSLATAFNSTNSTNRWVEIQVGSAQPIQPRQRILSAPFALVAENAANLMVGGNRAIGYSPGKNGLFINQGEHWPSTYFGGQVGIGNFDAGNILATEALLHVLDDNPVVKIQQNPGLPGGASLILGAAGSGTNKVRIVMHGITLESASGGSGDYLNVHNGRVGTIAYFGSDGLVGIGTDVPATRLHVHGGELDGILRLETSGAGKAPAIQFKNSIGTPVLHTIGQETSVGGGLLTGSTARALVISAQGPNPIQFGVNERLAVTIADGGDVGIGVTPPRAKLHVYGNQAYIQGNAEVSALDVNQLGSGHIALFRGGTGRVGIGTTSPSDTLHVAGDIRYTGVLKGPSDRNIKENFVGVDGRKVLALLAKVPISVWNFTNDVNRTPHMGPVAQDFHAAFKLGDDDKTLTSVDADGVAMAAIQGLHELVQEKDAQIRELRKDLDELRALVGHLSSRVEVR